MAGLAFDVADDGTVNVVLSMDADTKGRPQGYKETRAASRAIMFGPAVLPSIVENMRGGSDEEKIDALSQLAQIMEASVGEDAEELCEYLRVTGAVQLI